MQEHEPTVAEMLAMAEDAYKSIPAELRNHVETVVFHIEEFADDETLDEMDIDDPYDLLGLYRGADLSVRDSLPFTPDVDRVFLYREPILDYCDETGETPEEVVRHVLIHEIGHHFGLSDEDMERIELEAEETK
jgi:predicted Zn-dependent protease with MMP-like domain